MMRLRLFQKVIFLFLFMCKLEAFPSTKFDRDMISAANPQFDDDFDIPLNITQTTYGTGPSTKLIPLPHVLCTGFSIGGILETCFPVGCICAKGAGICDMASKCIRKTTFFNINFNKDLIEPQPGQA